MDNTILEQIKCVAFLAQEAASQVIMPFFRCVSLEAEDKRKNDDWDPVTQADYLAELEIRKIIEHYYPDHNILGEECGYKNNNSDFEWVIDPIDGTRAFMVGIPLWGILIGVTYKGKPCFGLASQPYIGEIFYGDGQKAFLRSQGQERILKTRDIHDIAKAHSLCTSPDNFITDEDKSAFIRLKQSCLHTRFGTDFYGYMSVAMGCGDIVFETGLSPYDITALIPILTGAGAIVTHPTGSDDISDGAVLVASNIILHETAKKIIAYRQYKAPFKAEDILFIKKENSGKR